MQAIETVYKGYRFRSRLEARWAVFFDAAHIKWEYEKEGYVFEDGEKYLPDFWLPEYFIFVEIKGVEITEREHDKCLLLTKESGYPVIAFCGTPVEGEYPSFIFSKKDTGYLCVSFIGYLKTKLGAIAEAKSARFEFGEHGGRA